MVHPLMQQTSPSGGNDSASTIAARVIDLLPRLHVLVVGPGLGRDRLMQDTVAEVVGAARDRGMPVVLDADALILAGDRPELLRKGACMLTPNVAEFGRLCRARGVEVVDGDGDQKGCEKLARAFGGVTIVRKGRMDVVSDGDHTVVCDVEGGYKRSGGQGDTLTGCLATFLAWRKAYLEHMWE
jgi:ATP-dependent NAD(P)H-hydrate dehydratase